MIQREKYKKIFLAEANEKITALNTALLGLEKNPTNSSLADDAMRASHTIKSSSAAMGYLNISHLAHAMEDLFEKFRVHKRSKISPQVLEVLFSSTDVLNASVRAIKSGGEEYNTKGFVEILQKIKDSNTKIDDKEFKSKILDLKSSVQVPIDSIKVDIDILDKLMNLTEELLVNSMRLNETLRKFQNIEKNETQNTLQIEKKISLGSDISKLKTAVEGQNRLLSDLQYNVTQARMIPLGQIFERLPRIIRDLSKEKKKEIEMSIEGQDIELDRTIIDRLGEPLMHLLRNAVDHGISQNGNIKLIATREKDKVLIEIIDDGVSINWENVIKVATDRGIISDKKEKEFQLQIASFRQKDNKTPLKSEIKDLLYHPRLSTKDKVTETSGRGIGLSIVKNVIESLGGSVQVESPIKINGNSSSGTKFTLELPLTLAIIQALLVRSASQIFALPFSQVDRSVRVLKKDMKKAFDNEMAVVDEENIPMIRLDKMFNIQKERGGDIFLNDEEMEQIKYKFGAELIVIVKKGEKPIGVVIDELISEQDIVVKPFGGVLKRTKGFAGTTLLGDGQPALIIDVETLI